MSEETIYQWQREHVAFSEALTRAREQADGRVARSLFQAACGYSHPAVHISNYKGEITETPYTKHYPPDAKALALWLKNRQPGLWRDKPRFDPRLRAEAKIRRGLALVCALCFDPRLRAEAKSSHGAG